MAYLVVQTRNGNPLNSTPWERGMIVEVREDTVPWSRLEVLRLVRIDVPDATAADLEHLAKPHTEGTGDDWRLLALQRWKITPGLLQAAEASGRRAERSRAQLEAVLIDRGARP